MKSTGIVRKVDELGRVVIPIEIRNTLGVSEKDPLEVYTDGLCIILRKNEKRCIICGNKKKLKSFKSNLICSNCIKNIKNLDLTK